MENSQRLLSKMQLLKEQLLATGTDVSKVQLQLEQLRTQKLLINSKYEQLLNALKLSMGLPLNQSIAIDPTIIYQEPQAYAPQPSVDFRLAGMQQQLLSSELDNLRNSRLPTISLFGTFGTTGYGYDEAPNEFLRFYPLGFAGIQMSQTLFNGTVTQRKIKQKQLELQNSELQLSLLNDQTDMQLANALQQQAVAQQSVETSLSQIALAQSVYTQTLTQQKQGTASLTEVLLADGALREAQQAYLTAVVDYLKALLELKKISGNLPINTSN
jgi:outer membrane protein TolC